MVLRRDSLKTIHTKPYKIGGNKGKKIIDKLGFELTNAQIKVINEISDYVIVLKNGKIIEEGNTDKIFKNPSNQYTLELLKSIL